jgi:ABC-type transport system involved in multi-copper enzyme maturation permease subunit
METRFSDRKHNVWNPKQMINLKNIWTVALYERKTLFRSWFFRIFSVLTLVILFGLNMGLFAGSGARWTGRAIAANIPLINVLFVNVAQAVIAVFLASDFMQRDRKLDTTEVIYARPISNGEYVTGKTLGIMVLFIGLVFTVLLMALAVNLVISDTPVVWQAYLLYPLLISVPTLLFILGLAFFLMILFRSQAVTFIVLLGYIGLTLFYFKDKLYGTFDYMAFHLPMAYSDFIGFADLPAILLHRTAYLLLGFGFIFATIRFLRRLPQTGRWHLLNLLGFILFIAAGTYAGYTYYFGFHQQEEAREHFLQLNNRYADYPAATVEENNLVVEQRGKRLIVTSQMRIRNANDVPLDTLLFSLNPAFRIDSITIRGNRADYSGNEQKYRTDPTAHRRGNSTEYTRNEQKNRTDPTAHRWGNSTEYTRNEQFIRILPEEPIEAGRRTRVTIYYRGVPEASVAYLDISKKRRASLKRIYVATLDKRPGIIDDEYMLLTRELLWYPVAGVGFNTRTFHPAKPGFTRFSLSVKPERGLTAVAPGQAEEEEGWQHFTPGTELNSLPLVIGPFEKRSLTAGEIEYNLYLKPGHDYFSGHLAHITDTLAPLINEAREDYEYDEIDLYYAFKRLNIVEVPVQYHPYERPYSRAIESVQPEMLFLPEKGAGINTLDFKRFKNAEERRNRERDNARTAEEIEIDLVKNLLRNTFFTYELSSRGRFRRQGEELITYDGDRQFTKNPWCLFPLYFNYVTTIASEEYPVFNTMIGTYLEEGYEVQPRESFMGGISDIERANLALKEQSLAGILARQNVSLVEAAIYQSGSFVLNALKNRVGASEFDNFLYYYLEDHAFRVIPFEQFETDFFEALGVEIAPYLEFIKTANQLPEFLVGSPGYYSTRDDYGDVYVVNMELTNTGGSDGLIDLTFRIPPQGGFGGGGRGMDTEQRLFEVAAGTTKEVQMIFYSQPRMLTVNTLISGNIPSTFSLFLRSAEERTIPDPQEYERVTEYMPETFADGEIVVDNEDDEFSYISVSNESKIKKYIDSRKEETDNIHYRAMNPGWTPATWTPVAHASFYGQTIRSAMLSGSGDGRSVARWSAVMPEAGFYDLYVYIPVSAMLSRPLSGRGRGGDGGERGSGRGGFRGPEFADNGTEYHYTVSSNEGAEVVRYTLDNPEEGWNRLGTFHFPADTATVELSNSTNGKRVVADAVRWVRRDF